MISKLVIAASALSQLAFAAGPAPLALETAEGVKVAEWQAAAHPRKPFVAQLFVPGAAARGVLDVAPDDHPHHHGLMFAVAVDGVGFWGEQDETTGSQQPVGEVIPPHDGMARQQLRWIAGNGDHLLDERRTLRVRVSGGESAVHWLDWRSELTPAEGRAEVELTGLHYYGFGMRMRPEWTGTGEFLWAGVDGQKVVRGDEKLTPGAWCAVRTRVDGEPITVLMVDHPENPRPARWFTMGVPFCYLSATLDLEERPARLAGGQLWSLQWGVAVISGAPAREQLSALAREWVEANPNNTETNNPTQP